MRSRPTANYGEGVAIYYSRYGGLERYICICIFIPALGKKKQKVSIVAKKASHFVAFYRNVSHFVGLRGVSAEIVIGPQSDRGRKSRTDDIAWVTTDHNLEEPHLDTEV